MKSPESSVAFQILETETEKSRLMQVWRTATAFYPEEIVEVFVSETRDEAGRQVVGSIWFFTESIAAEFKRPMQEDDFDATPLRDLAYLNVTKKDFDFGDQQSVETSRMTVHVRFQGDIVGGLQASFKNCPELLRITRATLMPNLVAR